MDIKIALAVIILVGLAGANNVSVSGEGVETYFNGVQISDGTGTFAFTYEFNTSPIIMDDTIKLIVGYVNVSGVRYPVFPEGGFLWGVWDGDYHPALDSNSYYFARVNGTSYDIYETLTADSQIVTQKTDLRFE